MGRAWTRTIAAAALLSAGAASAQDPAEINQVRGVVEFTNSSPEVLAVLGEPGNRGLDRILASVVPEVPGRRPIVSTSSDAETATRGEYQLAVEAGVPGRTHLIAVSSSLSGPPFGSYRFLPRESPPVEPEPAPDAVLDFRECVGVVELRFVDGAGFPAEVASAHARGRGELSSFFATAAPLATSLHLPVRGDGTPFELSVELELPVGETGDFVRIAPETVLGVGCDEIVPWEITLPALDDVGRIVGRFDLVGVDELPEQESIWQAPTRIEARGPVSNHRVHPFSEPPANGPFELANLLPSSHFAEPSSYSVQAHAGFLAGPSLQVLSTAEVDRDLAAFATVDLGDSFVMTPAWFDGELLLRAPAADPVDSPFLDLVTSTEPGFPLGLPPVIHLASLVRIAGSAERVPGASRPAAPATTEGWMDGSFGGGARSWQGAYSLAVAQPDGEPGRFRQERLELRWEDRETPERPETYIDERLRLDLAEVEHDLWPGDRRALRQELCLSELRLAVAVAEGAVFGPRVILQGSFDGLDPSGRPLTYESHVSGQGTPLWEGEAGEEALVNLYVPEGDHEVWASVLVATADGGYASVTTWEQEVLSVPCGQVLEPRPGLSVRLDTALPDCSGAPLAAVSGSVQAELEIARLTWSVNGGAETVLCEPCGLDPSFAFDAPLGERDNWLSVRAVDAEGREAAVRSVTRHAPEPSALDRDPAAQPLRVSRPAGSRLRLSWERPAHDRFNVYQGTLDSLRVAGAYDHRRLGACEREEAELSFRAPAGDLYYLVSSDCGAGEGSYGRDSRGAERPTGANACP